MTNWSGGLDDGDELLSEFLGETLECSLFGLKNLCFVVGNALLDEVVALDHDAPKPGGEFARQSHSRDQASASGAHAPIEAAQGDVFAAREALRHHAEQPASTIATALDATLALAGGVICPGRGRSTR